jgi:hypothetical protein
MIRPPAPYPDGATREKTRTMDAEANAEEDAQNQPAKFWNGRRKRRRRRNPHQPPPACAQTATLFHGRNAGPARFAMLEHFPMKWRPVHRKKMRQPKHRERAT